MKNLPNIPDGGDTDDARSPNVFETPFEEKILGAELPDDTRTVSPDEEGPNTRGFQHGSWDFEHDNADRDLVGTLERELENDGTVPDNGS